MRRKSVNICVTDDQGIESVFVCLFDIHFAIKSFDQYWIGILGLFGMSKLVITHESDQANKY
jgi:hypothetical protein